MLHRIQYLVALIVSAVAVATTTRDILLQPEDISSSTSTSSHRHSHHRHRHRDRHREIWAWAGAGRLVQEQIAQLRNSTWHSLLDGIQLGGCVGIVPETGRLELNETAWNLYCHDIAQAAVDTNTKIQLWIGGDVPDSNDHALLVIQDSLAIHQRLYEQYNIRIDGYSWDDERDCAPRRSLAEFERWIAFQNAFTHAMNEHNLTVSSAVQAIFGIQDNANNDACDRKPSAYSLQPDVVHLIQTAVLDQWLVMDTYYFTTARFLSALDWYTTYFDNPTTLGIGLLNRDERTNNTFTEDELVARFYALHHHGIRHLNVFILPVAESFLPYLQRWKTHCRGCGQQRLLGCFDMSIECKGNDQQQQQQQQNSEHDGDASTKLVSVSR